MTTTDPDAISIVGAACEYPGARSPEELFQLTLTRRTAFRSIPRTRLDLSSYGGSADHVDRTYVERAGLIEGWTFDRAAFGVNGTTHRSVDTAHWLALDVASRALSDAGFAHGIGLEHDRVGVVVGNTLTGERSREMGLRLRWPWVEQAVRVGLSGTGLQGEALTSALTKTRDAFVNPLPEQGVESLAGSLSNTIAGRIANHFDFRGAGYTIDGACASSSLAIVEACRSLVAGDLDVAIAGGVDVSLDPLELVGFARLGALAVDEMRVYDARPTGFLPGEGCGLVVLMRAADAERQGVRRYADIVGWGISSDGAGGITRPEAAGQSLAIERALDRAGLKPDAVGIIEGHGTGTAVGDSVELRSLADVRRGGQTTATIGSIKANIGHTKAAAGVASLIKATMAVNAAIRPPATGVETPHEIVGASSSLRLLDEPEAWTSPRRIAGISAMGFGGVNTHLLITEPSATRRFVGVSLPGPGAGRMVWPVLVPLAASTSAQLRGHLDTFAEQSEALSEVEFERLVATLHRRFGDSRRWEHRAAIHASSQSEAAVEARRLASLIDATATDDRMVHSRAGSAGHGVGARVGLLFPGQAAPVRWDLSRFDSLAPTLTDAAARDRPGTASAQPAILRSSLAGLAFLKELELEPDDTDEVVGHSLGEIAAYVWAGALHSADALALAERRGELMEMQGVSGTGMVGLDGDEESVAALTSSSGLQLACRNGGGNFVLAGFDTNLAAAITAVSAQGRRAVRLPVSRGFHSTAMDPVVGPFTTVVAKLDLRTPTRSIRSTVTGGTLSIEADWRQNLVEQLTRPVLFDSASEPVLACDVIVEVGSGTLLSDMVRGRAGHGAVFSLDIGGDARSTSGALAALYAAGRIDITQLDNLGEGLRALDLGEMPRLLESLLVPEPAGPDRGAGASSHRTPVAPSPVASFPDVPQAVSPADTAASTVAEDEPVVELSLESALAIVTSFLADRLELPRSAIDPDGSLLRDLHLNSLRVGQLVTEVLQENGRPALVEPLDAAMATVRDVASLLHIGNVEGAKPMTAAPGPSWAHAFEHGWEAATLEVDALPEDVLQLHTDRTDAQPSGKFVRFLESATAEPEMPVVVVHDGTSGAAGLARCIAEEYPDRAVLTVVVEDQTPPKSLPVLRPGYQEYRYAAGSWWSPVTRSLALDDGHASSTLRDGVVLVTGGVTGLMASVAQAVVDPIRHRVVVLGRRPSDAADVSAAAAELPPHIEYRSCDVTDARALRALVEDVRSFGPIRAVIHGAGVNAPQRMNDVTVESFERTWAPKVLGLENLLDALDPVANDLDLLLAFGSIIARRGLAGQTEYAAANDAMRAILESWGERHLLVRTHYLEWSVWAGRGMGESLGVLDSLRAMGVEPLLPKQATSLLRGIVVTPNTPRTVLLTARCPDGPGLQLPRNGSADFSRFDEARLEVVEDVVAVVDTRVDIVTDRALADHQIDGMHVLPAVMGLEAVTQVARVAGWKERSWAFESLRFDRPIVVPEGTARVLRTSVAAEPIANEWRAVVRDDQDDFASPRFTMTIVPQPENIPQLDSVRLTGTDVDASAWYGPLFFHGRRFERVAAYGRLSAFTLAAQLSTPTAEPWFGPLLPPALQLGDPGALDASLHMLMAAAPHRRVLPVAADYLFIPRPDSIPSRVQAVERSHSADEFVFDVDLLDDSTEIVAAWRGLRLRVVGDLPAGTWPEGLPLGLLGPWLSRCIIDAGGPAIEIIVQEGDSASSDAMQALGWPVVESGGVTSAAHTGGLLFLANGVDGRRSIGIDAEVVTGPRSVLSDPALERWQRASIPSETDDRAPDGLEAWTLGEALVKLGRHADTSMGADARDQGLVRMRGDGVAAIVGTLTVQHDGTSLDLAVAVAWREG
ncbi:type I polyketide synthase [Agromyces intestinalis]|nr:type I polyketide synthase [Agromyces intestinalis]